jgi:hypothetical protein
MGTYFGKIIQAICPGESHVQKANRVSYRENLDLGNVRILSREGCFLDFLNNSPPLSNRGGILDFLHFFSPGSKQLTQKVITPPKSKGRQPTPEDAST